MSLPDIRIIYQGDQAPKKPRVMPWHWIAYYAYNLARKPKVWRLKHEQNRIYKSIYSALESQMFPLLARVAPVCPHCRNAYGSLTGQVYISMIRMIVKNMQCENHPEIYVLFLQAHADKFDRNEVLAAEINGFKR